jgi:thiamine biosynthesis lipoprotein ApbE
VKVIASLCACLLAGCGAYQPRVDITTGVRRVNGDDGPVACLGVTQRVNERVSAQWQHCSDPSRGYPVDDRYDVSHDTLGVTWSFWGKPR